MGLVYQATALPKSIKLPEVTEEQTEPITEEEPPETESYSSS